MDTLITNFASLCAICVALFPTPEDGKANPLAFVHYGAAGSLFILFAILALLRFPLPGLKTGQSTGAQKMIIERESDPPDSRRNLLFRICGCVILVMLVITALFWILDLDGPWLFFTEAIMVEAFGISWLAKSLAPPTSP